MSWFAETWWPFRRWTRGKTQPLPNRAEVRIGAGLAITDLGAAENAVELTASSSTPSSSTPQPVGTVGAAGTSGQVPRADHVHALAWGTVNALSLNQSLQIDEIDVASAHVLSLVFNGFLGGTLGITTAGAPGAISAGGVWTFDDGLDAGGNVVSGVAAPMAGTDAANREWVEAYMGLLRHRVDDAGGQTAEFYVPIYEASGPLNLTRIQVYPHELLPANADHWQLTIARVRGGVPTVLVDSGTPGVGINLNTGSNAWDTPSVFSPLTEVGQADDLVFAKFVPTGPGVDPFPPFTIFVGVSPV